MRLRAVGIKRHEEFLTGGVDLESGIPGEKIVDGFHRPGSVLPGDGMAIDRLESNNAVTAGRDDIGPRVEFIEDVIARMIRVENHQNGFWRLRLSLWSAQ